MQSKTSFFSWAIFKKNLKKTAIVGILYFVIWTLAMPVFFIDYLKWSLDDPSLTAEQRLYRLNYDFASSIRSTEYTWLVMFAVIICCAIVFKYLFIKRDNYMIHAFPVSRKALFFSGAAAVFVTLAVPTILNTIVMFVVGLTHGVTHLSLIFYWMFANLGTILFFTGLATFSLMLTGQLVTGIIFYFIFNTLWLAMEFTLRMIETVVGFGLGTLGSMGDYNALTPVVFINNHCNIMLMPNYDKSMMLSGYTAQRGSIGIMIGYIVAGIVLLAVAMAIYNKKKLESVNDFIPLKPVQVVFSVGMSFFVSAFIGVGFADLVASLAEASYGGQVTALCFATIVIGVVLFFAIQMLIDRSVRVFTARRVKLCAIYSAGALVVLLAMTFDLFGVEKKIPEQDQIVWAGISGNQSFVFDGADEIDQVRKIHAAILDNKKEIRDMKYTRDDVEGTSYTIKYKLANGKSLTREYYLKDDNVVGGRDYAATVALVRNLLNDPTRIKEHVIGKFYDSCDVREINFTVVKWNEEGQYFDSFYPEMTKSENRQKEVRREIYEALLKDIDAGVLFQCGPANQYDDKNNYYNDFYMELTTADSIVTDEDVFYGWSDTYGGQYYRYLNVTLNKDCINTLKALKDNGYYEDESDLITFEEVNSRDDSEVILY